MNSAALMPDALSRVDGRREGGLSARSMRARLHRIASACYPWAYVSGWAVMVYLMINTIDADILTASVNTYLVRPLLWMSLLLMGLIGWREGVRDKPRLSPMSPISGALAGTFQVAAIMIAGLIFGFGHSPYSHQPLAILGNLVHVGSMLVAFEVSRACILGSFGARKPYLALAFASILFALLELPTAWTSSFGSAASGFRFVGETLLPGLSESLLASFLVFTGGPVASLAYRGLLHGFEWLSPILPRLDWSVAAFMGTIVPALGLVLLRRTLWSATEEDHKDTKQERSRSTSWVLVAVTAVTMLWFNTGMFGVRPTIVNGVSMNPALSVGDFVITQEIDPGMIQVGDIIQFRRGGDFILHRVVETEGGQNGYYFITRGDSNNVDDDPVPAEAVTGKVVFVIPKLGWLGIAPRLLINRIGDFR